MNISQAVTARLLELCGKQGISINKLSTESAVRQSTVNDIAIGKTKNPGIVTIKKLCDGLGITIVEFFATELFAALEQEIK